MVMRPVRQAAGHREILDESSRPYATPDSRAYTSLRPAMLTTRFHPVRDTVLYDGRCRFCRSHIALLRALTPVRRPDFI